jgi:Xaa-Pro aminopeptidase
MTRKILYNEMSHVGLKDYSALVLFGPNAALPHGSGTDRTLGSDEFALIDAGGYWGGYIADITRVS